MDSINVPESPSKPLDNRSSSVSMRRLWQVPVFFIGLMAIVTAFLTRGLVGSDPVRQFHRDLAETRRLLERQNLDADTALQHAQRAIENLMFDQGRAAEAFFLLGSARLAVAGRHHSELPSTDSNAPSAELKTENLEEARQNLAEAERRGLSGADLNRLHYLLAKIKFYERGNPAEVIQLLQANVESADDRAEALTLLSQAYLRMSPPNLDEALKANKKLREEVPQIGEDVLGPAKLAGAKLLLQLNKREEARRTLEKINAQAPPAILAEKHMLLAGLYQEEHKWAEAAQLWRIVRDDKRVPLAEAGGVLYNLGVCYRHLDNPGSAAEAWNDCLRRSHGEEAQAAALALAELRLHETNPENGVAMLAEAVAKVRKAEDWKNSLVELANVRDLFEQAITIYRQADRFDLAVRTAELFERVAAPPKAQVRRAELNSEWAKAVRERARSAKDEASRKKEESTADELSRHAAEARSEASKLVSGKEERGEHLWLSAVCSYEGHDYARAADKLKEIVEREKDNVDRLSEGLFLLGETCRNLNDLPAAETAYKACVERRARFAYRARYQLAMMGIEGGRIDDAVRELEQNILIEQSESDPDAQEKSRLALCSLLYQSASSLPQNYRRVVQCLEGHLDHFAATPESVRSRYQLADSYRQLVAHHTINRTALSVSEKTNPEAFDHFLKENKRYWARAAEEFGKLEEQIKNAELATLLSSNQQAEISFHIAECYFYLGEYEKALNKYEELVTRWGKHQRALRAMGETIRCFASMSDFEKIRQRCDDIRERLATTEGLSENERKQWIEWLNQVGKTPPNQGSDAAADKEPIIINGSRSEPKVLRERGGPVLDPQK